MNQAITHNLAKIFFTISLMVSTCYSMELPQPEKQKIIVPAIIEVINQTDKDQEILILPNTYYDKIPPIFKGDIAANSSQAIYQDFIYEIDTRARSGTTCPLLLLNQKDYKSQWSIATALENKGHPTTDDLANEYQKQFPEEYKNLLKEVDAINIGHFLMRAKKYIAKNNNAKAFLVIQPTLIDLDTDKTQFPQITTILSSLFPQISVDIKSQVRFCNCIPYHTIHSSTEYSCAFPGRIFDVIPLIQYLQEPRSHQYIDINNREILSIPKKNGLKLIIKILKSKIEEKPWEGRDWQVSATIISAQEVEKEKKEIQQKKSMQNHVQRIIEKEDPRIKSFLINNANKFTPESLVLLQREQKNSRQNNSVDYSRVTDLVVIACDFLFS